MVMEETSTPLPGTEQHAGQAALPSWPAGFGSRRLFVVRLLAVVTVAAGLFYITWRWTSSLNWTAWWISVPLVLAETYMLADVALFALTVSRARKRPAPPAAPEGASVDVFITSYDEPVDLVLATALAAQDIRYPHRPGSWTTETAPNWPWRRRNTGSAT